MTTTAKPLDYWWKVEDRGFSTPCWIWIGAMGRDNYGVYVTGSGSGKKGYAASRYVYQKYKKLIPKGMQLDYLCTRTGDVNRIYCKRCVNPDHMEVVTPKENSSRRSKIYCMRLEQRAKGVKYV